MSGPRIGLLGGSFDPPHRAHLALAQVAQATLALDELRWLPAGAPWQKAGRALAPAEHRRAMVAALIDGLPHQAIDDRELRRSGPTYTLDTVLALRAEQPGAEWFMVIGQDQYARLHTWHGWQQLLPLVTWAVAGRAGQDPTPPAALAAVPHRVVALPLPRTDIAASEIRTRLNQGLSVTDMVGDGVARYIDQHRLYRAGTGS